MLLRAGKKLYFVGSRDAKEILRSVDRPNLVPGSQTGLVFGAPSQWGLWWSGVTRTGLVGLIPPPLAT